jgi:uncharacterized membrane protein YkoI
LEAAVKKLKNVLMAVAALAALALGGSAIAGAVSGDDATTTQQGIAAADGTATAADAAGAGQRGNETALTGDTATRVSEAAQAEVEGGTVERVETDADGNAAYEAHVVKPDGSRVTVYVDEQFNVVDVEEDAGGPGRRTDEEELTGDTATRVTQAAQAEVEGGTVERVETDADGNAAYEAHVVKSDGSRVTVYVDEQFNVVGVEEGPAGPAGQQDGGAQSNNA